MMLLIYIRQPLAGDSEWFRDFAAGGFPGTVQGTAMTIPEAAFRLPSSQVISGVADKMTGTLPPVVAI